MLRIDSNRAYSLATARRLARPLEDLGVRNWEDPVPSIEAMAELRRHCSIPFSTHNTDIARAIALKVPDAICGNPTVLGLNAPMHSPPWRRTLGYATPLAPAGRNSRA